MYLSALKSHKKETPTTTTATKEGVNKMNEVDISLVTGFRNDFRTFYDVIGTVNTALRPTQRSVREDNFRIRA